MNIQRRRCARRERRGITLVLATLFLVAIVAMIGFAIDIGNVVLVRTQLQAAADASVMAAAAFMTEPRASMEAVAQQYAGYHSAMGRQVTLDPADIQYGVWDVNTRTFAPTPTPANALRVTTRRNAASGGEVPMFFGRIFGFGSFAQEASAVAMANPRDIAFAIDLSGSMNDDTEPAWVTGAINSEFGSSYPNVGNDLMQKLYQDFGFGSFPGNLQYIGKPLGLKSDRWAYAEMTKNGGPLAAASIPAAYRILDIDTETVRKQKAYRWMIDNQIAPLMPAAVANPTTSTSNYGYWEKYLDYLLRGVTIKLPSPPSPPGPMPGPNPGGSGGSPPPPGPPGPPPPPPPPTPPKLGRFRPAATGVGWASMWLSPLMIGATPPPGTPPVNRGYLPPSQDSDRINRFNNPNKLAYPGVSSSVPRGFRNLIGYRTYVQFMVDFGRDLKPLGGRYTPLSVNSPDCPYHAEPTAGGTFSFPPSTQPMHAVRRSLIAAMKVVKDRNSSVPDPKNRDWVSVITFDRLTNSSPAVHLPLTSDYDHAMKGCTDLQAAGDKGASTATEAGLDLASQHIRFDKSNSVSQGREGSSKVVVLLTDGIPNLWTSDNGDIDNYVTNNPSSNYYGGGYYWLDAPLMQTAMMQLQGWKVFPVGVGLGTDYDFMDRMARTGGTADNNGQSSRGSGNPAEYEQRMTDIFEEIINNPQVRLVQ